MVPDEPALFNQTIGDNILSGKEEAEMVEAARAAMRAHLSQAFPKVTTTELNS